MKADVKIIFSKSRNYILRIQTDKGTMKSNLVPLSKDDARILSKTLGIEIEDANVEDLEVKNGI